MDGSTGVGTSTRPRVRWSRVTAVMGVVALVLGAYTVVAKDINGVPLLFDDVVEEAAPGSADVDEVCAEEPGLALTDGAGGRLVLGGGHGGLTLAQAEAELAARGYDVTLVPSSWGPVGAGPGEVTDLAFGGDTVVVAVDAGLAFVEPVDGPITAEVTCLPRRGLPR